MNVNSIERKGAEIALTWDPMADWIRRNEWDDGIILCAYAVAQELAAINEEAALRQDGKLQLRLPEGMETLSVHLYLICMTGKKPAFPTVNT